VYTANVSWYTASDDECGKSDGITAIGEQAVARITVAADDLPLGTRVRIDGHEYIVQDRFGGGYVGRIDIYCESKEEAFANGRQMLEVEVLE
jgi:3D (Asp-Asp-Asp) domain-containing protein